MLRAIKSALKITDYSRWRENVAQVPGWDERNVIIGNLIPANSSVLDLGSGAQTLRGHLKAGCLYVPCDLVKSSPDVIVCDFNRGHFPKMNRLFDYTVCSGLLEYIRDPKTFLLEIKGYAWTALISYYPSASGTRKRVERLGHGWINHLSRAEIEHLFRQAGYQFDLIDEWRNHLLFRLNPVPPTHRLG